MLTLFISPATAIVLTRIAIRTLIMATPHPNIYDMSCYFRNWGEDERSKTGSQNNCSESSPVPWPAGGPQTGDSGRHKGQTSRGKGRSDVSGNQQVLTGGQQNNNWSQESLQVSVEDPDPGLFLNLGAALKCNKLKKYFCKIKNT
jgi:hypothetical protein